MPKNINAGFLQDPILAACTVFLRDRITCEELVPLINFGRSIGFYEIDRHLKEFISVSCAKIAHTPHFEMHSRRSDRARERVKRGVRAIYCTPLVSTCCGLERFIQPRLEFEIVQLIVSSFHALSHRSEWRESVRNWETITRSSTAKRAQATLHAE